MRRFAAQILIVFAAAALIVTSLRAHATHLYTVQGGKVIRQGYSGDGRGGRSAIVCVGANCMRVACSSCHALPADTTAYNDAEVEKHFRSYFARAELQIAEGQSFEFGGFKLRRIRNRIALVDEAGKTHLLAVDARVLKDRGGQPLAITYLGSAPPVP